MLFTDVPTRDLLPMVSVRKNEIQPVHSELKTKAGDVIWVAIHSERETEAFEWLRAQRMVPRDLPTTPRDESADEKSSGAKAKQEPEAEEPVEDSEGEELAEDS